MKQFILNSFISKGGGGNKAAVVFDDLGMSERQMQEVAKKNNFSETAFIDIRNSGANKFVIRYFTPTDEVDICGHAALASFHVLKELGYLKATTVYHLTKAGELKVLIEKDLILIEMKKPELVMELSKESVMEIVNISEAEIIPNNNGIIEVVTTGLSDIILEVTGIEALKNMNVIKDKMIDLCKEYNLVGMHVVSRETIEPDSDYCCRNFAPAVGIDEESATGTSNASWFYYLIRNSSNSINYDKTYKVEQGYFMYSPSNIYMKADKETGSIFVGGVARIDSTEEI